MSEDDKNKERIEFLKQLGEATGTDMSLKAGMSHVQKGLDSLRGPASDIKSFFSQKMPSPDVRDVRKILKEMVKTKAQHAVYTRAITEAADLVARQNGISPGALDLYAMTPLGKEFRQEFIRQFRIDSPERLHPCAHKPKREKEKLPKRRSRRPEF